MRCLLDDLNSALLVRRTVILMAIVMPRDFPIALTRRSKVVLTEFPPLLLVLWREQHPEGHEQTYIDFNVRKPPAQECATEL
jgi:hypothetical protein